LDINSFIAGSETNTKGSAAGGWIFEAAVSDGVALEQPDKSRATVRDERKKRMDPPYDILERDHCTQYSAGAPSDKRVWK
jgi:hypothetical protein